MNSPPVESLLALYRSPAASSPYDEDVTEIEHALQAADRAIDDGADDALVVAALLHDVGHLVADGSAVTTERSGDASFPTTDDAHERTGARLLRSWFGAAVTAPIALHVDAKRYLCATDDSYGDKLSASSIHSLAMQGGPMSASEVEAFERRRGWEHAVRLRRWDDDAKIPGTATRAFDDHLGRLRAVGT